MRGKVSKLLYIEKFLGAVLVVQVLCRFNVLTYPPHLVIGWLLDSQLSLVVPILGVPDALVPLHHPVSQISLVPGETTAVWVSIDVPSAQPPGQYEGEFIITAIKAEAESQSQNLSKGEMHRLYMELRTCLDIMEPIEGKPLDEMIFSDNGPVDMMDEDAILNLSVRVKLSLTVWDFVLPTTPSLPARVLTTYYCGPSDAPLAPTPFEAFVQVPKLLRPHTQIYCTSEWVLGNREDLVKDIISELRPENGEEWWTCVYGTL